MFRRRPLPCPPPHSGLASCSFPGWPSSTSPDPRRCSRACPGLRPISSPRASSLRSDRGLSLLRTTTFATCPPLDLLCAPGVNDTLGVGELLGFVRQIARTAQFVTSVCTGSHSARQGCMPGRGRPLGLARSAACLRRHPLGRARGHRRRAHHRRRRHRRHPISRSRWWRGCTAVRPPRRSSCRSNTIRSRPSTPAAQSMRRPTFWSRCDAPPSLCSARARRRCAVPPRRRRRQVDAPPSRKRLKPPTLSPLPRQRGAGSLGARALTRVAWGDDGAESR